MHCCDGQRNNAEFGQAWVGEVLLLALASIGRRSMRDRYGMYGGDGGRVETEEGVCFAAATSARLPFRGHVRLIVSMAYKLAVAVLV